MKINIILLAYGDRKFMQSAQQKEWIDQQIKEKEAREQREKQEKMLKYHIKLFNKKTFKN